MCAGLHTNLAASVLKHLGHKEKPVHGAVSVKRRQDLVNTSNPEHVSLVNPTLNQITHTLYHDDLSRL